MGNNTSDEAGYLIPVGTAPLEGGQLLDFLQEVIVGVTGLEGKMVRPRYVAEPANIPTAGDAWCAFDIMKRPSDMFPQVEHVTNDTYPEGADVMQRQETLHVLASFYDLGVDGLADKYASLLRDGLIIAQNREVLMANGFDFAYSGELQPVPVLLKMRWQYRVDIELTFRRQMNRTYNVLDLKKLDGSLKAQMDNGEILTDALSTTEPTP